MRFRFVEEQRGAFPIDRLCQVMIVCPRGLRAFRSRPARGRQRADMIVLADFKEQSRLSLGSYGRPRMTEELKEVGIDVGHRRVGRLMHENGITVERTRKFKATIDSDLTFNIAPNLLYSDFSAAGPNQKWAGAISYIWTRKGWLYLSVILDLHSCRVIGWAVSKCMKRDLAIRALKMAIAFRASPKGCIFHSDRGSQYCSHDYQKFLRQHGFRVSMSGKAIVMTMRQSIRSSKPSRQSCSGGDHGQPGGKLRSRSLNTSMASTIRDDATQHWAGKAPVAFERKAA